MPKNADLLKKKKKQEVKKILNRTVKNKQC